MRLPHGGEEYAWIGRVESEVYGARVVTAKQHALPVLAAVGGAEDAAFTVGTIGMTQCGYVNKIMVFRMDTDAGYVTGILKSHVSPGCAAVRGPVDAIAVGDVAHDACLAHPGVDDVGIRVCDGDCTDGRGLEEGVRDVFPVRTAVAGLPDAAGTGAEVKDHVLRGMPGYGDHASAAGWADVAPPQRIDNTSGDFFVNRHGSRSFRDAILGCRQRPSRLPVPIETRGNFNDIYGYVNVLPASGI